MYTGTRVSHQNVSNIKSCHRMLGEISIVLCLDLNRGTLETLRELLLNVYIPQTKVLQKALFDNYTENLSNNNPALPTSHKITGTFKPTRIKRCLVHHFAHVTLNLRTVVIHLVSIDEVRFLCITSSDACCGANIDNVCLRVCVRMCLCVSPCKCMQSHLHVFHTCSH